MKLPSFQFYPGDWLKDPALRACSHAAKGVCIDTLCLMFECVPRGVLVTGASPWSEKDWAAAVGGNGDVTAGCIRELLVKGVVRRRGDEPEAFQCRYRALLSDLPPGSYYSLRMVRDEHERLLTRERVRKHRGNAGGNGECNADVTPLKQPSSSSSSSSEEREREREPASEPAQPGRPEPPPPAPPPAPPPHPPTRRPAGLDECLVHAQFIGMSEADARDWHRDCQACGWTRGDGTPFDNWRRQMVVHRDHLAERCARVGPGARPNASPQPPPLSGAQIILRQKELERAETAIKAIQDQYDSHQSYSAKDRLELRRLRERKEVLKKMLNLEI